MKSYDLKKDVPMKFEFLDECFGGPAKALSMSRINDMPS